MKRVCTVEKFADAKPIIEALLVEQYAETGDARVPLDPNWTLYETMEKLGRLVLVVVWEGETPIGYAGGALHTHSNSRQMLIGTIPTWFIRPMPGRVFVEKAVLQGLQALLFKAGAQRVVIETNADHSAARLLEAMGGKATKISYEFAPAVPKEEVSSA